MKSKVNLKSSTYNQTGQNYFEQLEACNLMNWHLRRILLAKSVVDTRNKEYILRKKRQRKLQRACHEKSYLHPDVIDDVIDRLAYDTQHSMDVLKMDEKQRDCCNCCNLDFRRRCRQRSSSKSRKTSPTASPKRKKFISRICSRKDFGSIGDTPSLISPSTYSRQRPKSRSPLRETRDDRSVLSSPSRSCYAGSICDDKPYEQFSSKRLCEKEEDKKYTQFVYKITRDIMQNGFYTDKELQDVFKKHINQNKKLLNMNRMLYEIYQLKISLNVTDDSEDDEDLDDLIHAQKLLTVSEIRPPTPPKILDENKVMEKLESYQKVIDHRKRFPNGVKKSVTLIDANHELLVTEEDVLLSLMEGGVDPKRAQHICRNLLYRSRDALPIETVEVDAYSTKIGESYVIADGPRYTNNPTSEADNETSECIECTHDSVVSNDPMNLSTKQETCCSTSDLISMEAELIETERNTNSETQTKTTFEDDEVES